jgi:MFS family permease
MSDANVAPLPASPSYRLFLVCFGMLQITLAAGLIVGWAGIAGSMMVTPAALGGAGLTLDQTTAMFGLAASVNYISPLFLGMLLDHRGPRTCSAMSNALVAAGCFVFASAESFSGFSLGLCGMAFGGPGVQTSLMHLGNLFPARQFFVMGILGESITLSFAIFPLLDVIWEGLPQAVSFRVTFYVLAVLVCLSTLCSILFWPDAPYGSKKEVDDEPESKEGLLASDEADDVVKEAELAISDQPFTAQLTSGIYLRLSLFFFVTSFWANFYIATVTVEVGLLMSID